MKRRSFLAMLGLAPIAAAQSATADAVHMAEAAIGSLRATDIRGEDGYPLEYASIAVRDDKVSFEPYLDFEGLVPHQRARDEHGFSTVTHSFVDGEGIQRIVWIV